MSADEHEPSNEEEPPIDTTIEDVERVGAFVHDVGHIVAQSRVKAAHARAQTALLGRIAELAKTADAESLQRLADAYLTLPVPGEDE